MKRPARLLISLAVLLGLAACDSTADTADIAEQDRVTLEGCYSADCGHWTPIYAPDKSASSCILDAAADGTPSYVTIFDVADGGGECRGEIRVFIVGDGTAYRWEGRDTECDDESVVNFYDLQRCNIDSSTLEACRAQVAEWAGDNPSPNCTDNTTWLIDCQAVEDPSC